MTDIDKLRGHDFFPSEEDLNAIPNLYATEEVPVKDKIVHLHYFVGSCDWWIVELGEHRGLAFGYANLGDPYSAEWGYISMNELRGIYVRTAGLPVVVERDLFWVPTVASSVEGIPTDV